MIKQGKVKYVDNANIYVSQCVHTYVIYICIYVRCILTDYIKIASGEGNSVA